MGNFFNSKRFLVLLAILWVVSLAALLLLWLPGNRLSVRFKHQYPIAVQDVQPSGHGPYGYGVPMGTERLSQNEHFESPAQLFEDGQPLGPGNALHADIGTRGGGRFSFWRDGYLYFSASDNSDPRTNGRQYTLVLPNYTLIDWSLALLLTITLIFGFRCFSNVDMGKNQKIHALSLIILVVFALAVGFHYYYGVYQNRPYPYTTFLFLPHAQFNDYYAVVRDSHTLNPYLEYKSAQYPFLVILGYLFSLLPGKSYVFYLGFVSSLFLLFSILNLRGERWYTNATPIFIIAFLTYPFLVSADSGNFESLLCIFLLAFSSFYVRKQYLASTIFLSLAISMKMYPAILLILFIPERKYREIAVCLVTTVAITFASLMCFRGGLLPNLNFLLQGSNISSNSYFTQFISIDSNMVQRGVSLLTFFKIFYFETGLLPAFIRSNFSSIYMILAAIMGILVVLYVVFVENEIWKRVTLLIFSMLLLPTISADYKLLHVFILLYLFLNTKNPQKFDVLYLLLFGLLLIPKDFYYFTAVISEAAGNYDISISVAINILTMIVISALIMTSGTRNWIANVRKANRPVGSTSPRHP